MKPQGDFKVFQVFHANGMPEERLVGRFLIQGNAFNILEDNDRLLEDEVVDGPLTDRHLKFLHHLQHSPYYRLVCSTELNEGHHDDQLEELDIGHEEPETVYLLQEEGQPPRRLECYGERMLLDGELLTDEQVNNLMNEVYSGKISKIPI